MKLRDIVITLEHIAPLRFAETWDNVGLLAGDPEDDITKALLTIDMTHAVVHEAQALGCQLIITYHPPIFAALKRIDTRSPLGLALRLGIALYSPHTALDAASGGTNDVLADAAGLLSRTPLRPIKTAGIEFNATQDHALANTDTIGMGRVGEISPLSRQAFVQRIKSSLNIENVLIAGPREGTVSKVAVAAGAAGDLLKLAMRHGADAFLCGEMRHHDALAAAASEVTVICTRHSCSERQALVPLQARIAVRHPNVSFLISKQDKDPFDFA